MFNVGTDRGGVVVDDRCRLGTRQFSQYGGDVVVPFTPAAAVQVVFEVGGVAKSLGCRGGGLFWDKRSPEIGVQDSPGQIEHRTHGGRETFLERSLRLVKHHGRWEAETMLLAVGGQRDTQRIHQRGASVPRDQRGAIRVTQKGVQRRKRARRFVHRSQGRVR